MFSITLPIQSLAGIFDDPENLKVLPKDISPGELRKVMKMMTSGLGARCHHCHDGKPNQSIREYDFASDKKEMKLEARAMLKMVNAINNQFIGKMEGERMQVSCITCHRGVKVPRMTVDVLLESYAKGGLTTVITDYAQLRKDYYGTHSYDFSASVLRKVADGVSGELSKELETAKSLYQLNLAQFPEDFESHFMMGEIFAKQGDKDTARKFYKQALAIRKMPFVENKLKALDAK